MPVAERDEIWEAFVVACLGLGPIVERRSRYADKPALVLNRREIAHLEAPGVIDLRLTREGWREVAARLGSDPRVRREPGRRDWVELCLRGVDDVAELAEVLRVAVARNG